MKTKLGMITLVLAVCLTLAVGPAHAGKVNLDNNHPSNAYAVQVFFLSPSGTADATKCAAVNEEHEVNDPIASIIRIVVFQVDKCTNGQPGSKVGGTLWDKPYSGGVNTNYTATVAPSGTVNVTP